MATPVTKRQREDSKPKVQSLLFEALEANGSNYLERSIDARDYLRVEELDTTLLKTPPTALTDAQKWKALLILRRHLVYSLKKQYIQVETPHELWNQLTAQFLHEKTILLPQA